MNSKEYIASGILESYVLGELSEKEANEVLAMAQKHPEIKQELELIELGIEELAMKTAIKPSAKVKEKLFADLDEPGSEKRETKVVTISPSPYWRYVAAASITLAVVAFIAAYNFYDKWQNTQGELDQLIAQNERVAEDYNQVNQQLNEIQRDLEIINNPNFNRIALKGTDNAPDAQASVYWNVDAQEVYLSIQNLKALSQDQQYQLWAIIDGKPVDAGIFNASNATALLKMKNIGAGAGAFAVTVEPRGGSATPSLETMQVIGEVTRG